MRLKLFLIFVFISSMLLGGCAQEVAPVESPEVSTAPKYKIVTTPDIEKETVTIAAVNYNPVWGDKQANLEKIKGYIVDAAGQGADIVVIPELALSGYTVEEEKAMHMREAELIPGPSTNEIAKLTKEHNIYVIMGMPERDKDNPDIAYNSAAIIGPEGIIGSYQKIQPWQPEMKWCTKGDTPFLFDSPWGPIGVEICFDIYNFPELSRYLSARGALVVINPTAISTFSNWKDYYMEKQKSQIFTNGFYIVSANLVGEELDSTWAGYSVILGPGSGQLPEIYAGPASEQEEEMIIATLDLTKAIGKRNWSALYTPNPISGVPDWRPDLYSELYGNLEWPEE